MIVGRSIRLWLAAGLGVLFLTTGQAAAEFPRLGQPTRAERALAARGFDLDTASLVELIREGPDLDVRLDALAVLRRRPEEEVREPLLELFASESDPLVQRGLAIALARFGEEPALEFLRVSMREATRDGERTFLAATLARLGDLEGYPLLIAALDSESSTARSRARGALFDLAASDLTLAPPIELARMLRDALEDPEPWNRRGALSLVYRAVEDELTAESFASAVGRMASKDPDPKVREHASLILRRITRPRDPRLERVYELLRERQREEREKAIELERQRQQEQREESEEPPL